MNDEIVIDATIQGGKPVLRGTRVPVDAVLRALAAGDDLPRVTGNYRLTEAQVRAALAFAAEVLSSKRAIALPD